MVVGTSRRSLLGALALTGAGSVAGAAGAQDLGAFAVPSDAVLLNNAGTHPLPRDAARAISDYVAAKSQGAFAPGYRLFGTMAPARALFAGLINADVDEVALVPSTLAAENMVISSLGLRQARGNVVTEALHYDGALYLYRSLASEALEVRIAPARDQAIRLEDLDRLIDGNTRLVSVSAVSSINGFTHDLKAICDIAHAKGALVYADIIQAAGAVPIDVKATNVDFAGCGSYKWLMGDCGAGFLYVRKDLLGSAVHRAQWGYLQTPRLEQHPFADPTSPHWPVGFTAAETAPGYFEVGTPAFATLVGLERSLTMIREIGVETINAHARGLIDLLRAELPRRGHRLMTPPGPAPILAFQTDDAEALRKRLFERRIEVKAAHGLIRVSPGLFTTAADMERLIDALDG